MTDLGFFPAMTLPANHRAHIPCFRPAGWLERGFVRP